VLLQLKVLEDQLLKNNTLSFFARTSCSAINLLNHHDIRNLLSREEEVMELEEVTILEEDLRVSTLDQVLLLVHGLKEVKLH